MKYNTSYLIQSFVILLLAGGTTFPLRAMLLGVKPVVKTGRSKFKTQNPSNSRIQGFQNGTAMASKDETTAVQITARAIASQIKSNNIEKAWLLIQNWQEQEEHSKEGNLVAFLESVYKEISSSPDFKPLPATSENSTEETLLHYLVRVRCLELFENLLTTDRDYFAKEHALEGLQNYIQTSPDHKGFQQALDKYCFKQQLLTKIAQDKDEEALNLLDRYKTTEQGRDFNITLFLNELYQFIYHPKKQLLPYHSFLEYLVHYNKLTLFKGLLDRMEYSTDGDSRETLLEFIQKNGDATAFETVFLTFKKDKENDFLTSQENDFKKELINKLTSQNIRAEDIENYVINYKTRLAKDDISNVLDSLDVLKYVLAMPDNPDSLDKEYLFYFFLHEKVSINGPVSTILEQNPLFQALKVGMSSYTTTKTASIHDTPRDRKRKIAGLHRVVATKIVAFYSGKKLNFSSVNDSGQENGINPKTITAQKELQKLVSVCEDIRLSKAAEKQKKLAETRKKVEEELKAKQEAERLKQQQEEAQKTQAELEKKKKLEAEQAQKLKKTPEEPEQAEKNQPPNQALDVTAILNPQSVGDPNNPVSASPNPKGTEEKLEPVEEPLLPNLLPDLTGILRSHFEEDENSGDSVPQSPKPLSEREQEPSLKGIPQTDDDAKKANDPSPALKQNSSNQSQSTTPTLVVQNSKVTPGLKKALVVSALIGLLVAAHKKYQQSLKEKDSTATKERQVKQQTKTSRAITAA